MFTKKQRKKKIGNSENKRWEIGNEKKINLSLSIPNTSYHYEFVIKWKGQRQFRMSKGEKREKKNIELSDKQNRQNG